MSKRKPMPELGRCPYCGRKMVLDRDGRWHWAYCPNCQCGVEPCTGDYATERGAINAANRRAERPKGEGDE